MPPSSNPHAWLVLITRFRNVRCLMVSGWKRGSARLARCPAGTESESDIVVVLSLFLPKHASASSAMQFTGRHADDLPIASIRRAVRARRRRLFEAVAG